MILRSLKFGLAVAIVLALVSDPAMNCLSVFYQMDMQEMACCADMSGNCDMEADHSPCCQSVSDPGSASATVTAKLVSVPAPVILSVLPAAAETSPIISQHPVIALQDGSPPGAIPGSTTVLRI